MRLELHIDSDNDALSGPRGTQEVARILHKLADRLARQPVSPMTGTLMDVNGASVGTWNLEPSDDQEDHDSR